MLQPTPATSVDKVLHRIFTAGSPWRKAALAGAAVWTGGIFIACLWPGKELPHSDIPFIDKWTHFVLFGVFSFLWLCAYPPFPAKLVRRLLLITITAALLGCFVECLQLWMPGLGRSGDAMDALADTAGGALGAAGFGVASRWAGKARPHA